MYCVNVYFLDHQKHIYTACSKHKILCVTFIVYSLLEVCGHVENLCCVQVNDYNAKQPVDSGKEGDGSQIKCPHTHFVKPVKRHKHTLKHSQSSLMSLQEFCFSVRGFITFKHASVS